MQLTSDSLSQLINQFVSHSNNNNNNNNNNDNDTKPLKQSLMYKQVLKLKHKWFRKNKKCIKNENNFAILLYLSLQRNILQ